MIIVDGFQVAFQVGETRPSASVFRGYRVLGDVSEGGRLVPRVHVYVVAQGLARKALHEAEDDVDVGRGVDKVQRLHLYGIAVLQSVHHLLQHLGRHLHAVAHRDPLQVHYSVRAVQRRRHVAAQGQVSYRDARLRT